VRIGRWRYVVLICRLYALYHSCGNGNSQGKNIMLTEDEGDNRFTGLR